MDFGFIDSSKYTGRITYTSVTPSNGNWAFAGSGYAVGNGTFQALGIQAVYDFFTSRSPVYLRLTYYLVSVNTSSPFIFVPEQVVKAYYQKVPGVSLYVFVCVAMIIHTSSNMTMPATPPKVTPQALFKVLGFSTAPLSFPTLSWASSTTLPSSQVNI
jgi:hypothetical protein